MKAWRTIAGVAAAIIVAAVAAVLLLGPERMWRVFGEPDLGPVAFETLVRPIQPDDALACPAGLCAAEPDHLTASYSMPARELRVAFAKAIAAESRVVQVASDDAALTDRYIQRTPALGLPDTIVVRFIDLPDGKSTLAIYSRPQFGRFDLGANRARLDRWMARLAEVAPPDDLCVTHPEPGSAPQKR